MSIQSEINRLTPRENFRIITGPPGPPGLQGDPGYSGMWTEADMAFNILSRFAGAAVGNGNNILITPSESLALYLVFVSYNPASPAECAFRFGPSGALFFHNDVVVSGSIIAKDFGTYRVRGGADESLYLWQSAEISTICNVFYYEGAAA